ncbi:MAG: protein kinase, partial [Clostridia bacterium]|nr:protein kinase [Clostridia bacterium]
MSDKLLADRYEIVEKIGEGGMAYVYKGKDTLLDRYVAIKVLKPEYTQNEKFVENFIKESQAAAQLNNPNIVGVYDVGNAGRIHYIVMELVTGRPLSDIIKEKGKLDYTEAIRISKQVLNALSDAHKHQIVHRDVKPHNIIITEEGVAKLADFGIARPVSKESIEEGNEEIMGSVHYFSPEQARGTYVDERSDIYSFGIVLFEMLTGDVPYDGENAVEVAVQHINKPMPRVLDKVEHLPPKFGKIIDRCTAKY